jgi:hypothetical protein
MSVARRRVRRARAYFGRKRHFRKSKKIPILTVAGVAAGFLMPAATSGGGKSVFDNVRDGHFNWAVESLIENYTGYNIYNGSWNLINARGLGTAVLGAVGSKVMSMLGVNRRLSSVPMIGKYLSL